MSSVQQDKHQSDHGFAADLQETDPNCGLWPQVCLQQWHNIPVTMHKTFFSAVGELPPISWSGWQGWKGGVRRGGEGRCRAGAL